MVPGILPGVLGCPVIVAYKSYAVGVLIAGAQRVTSLLRLGLPQALCTKPGGVRF